jgi:hypothetical protein
MGLVTPRALVGLVGLTVAAAGCGGAEDTRDPLWSYISPAIMQPNCATGSCHNNVAAVSGLDLSEAEDGYASLLELQLPVRGNTPPSPRALVTPFNPTQSRLVNMLRAKGADRMPPDRPLAEADIRLIEQWILNGATPD